MHAASWLQPPLLALHSLMSVQPFSGDPVNPGAHRSPAVDCTAFEAAACAGGAGAWAPKTKLSDPTMTMPIADWPIHRGRRARCMCNILAGGPGGSIGGGAVVLG